MRGAAIAVRCRAFLVSKTKGDASSPAIMLGAGQGIFAERCLRDQSDPQVTRSIVLRRFPSASRARRLRRGFAPLTPNGITGVSEGMG